MLIKSQLVTQASGSIGGVTGSHNRGGMYLRARTIPTNPASAAQVAVRNLVGIVSAAWGATLTAAQRAAWETYAANTPVTNRLGDTIYLTGLNQYLRSNVPRIQAGLARVDAGPTTFGLPSFTSVTLTCSAAAQTFSVAYDNSDAWATETGGALMVYGSRGKSPTINYFKGPYRFLDAAEGDDTTPPTSPLAAAAWDVYVAGQALFARVQVCLADGRLSSPSRYRVLATA